MNLVDKTKNVTHVNLKECKRLTPYALRTLKVSGMLDVNTSLADASLKLLELSTYVIGRTNDERPFSDALFMRVHPLTFRDVQGRELCVGPLELFGGPWASHGVIVPIQPQCL
jgi:hypothetical protein